MWQCKLLPCCIQSQQMHSYPFSGKRRIIFVDQGLRGQDTEHLWTIVTKHVGAPILCAVLGQ